MSVGVAVIGAGRMGSRWAEVAAGDPGSRLLCVVDRDRARAEEVAARFGAVAIAEAAEVFARADVGLVVVATPHAALAEVSRAALEAGKHVFVEKPAGIAAAAVEANVRLAEAKGLKYLVGFNHRFHPAISLARAKLEAGEIGRPLFIRGVYGHGGRPGYGDEWRGDPKIAGGGELLDQGIHLIDLARWFLGEFETVTGVTATNYWPVAPLEDNAFVTLKTPGAAVANLHASWTQWKNMFVWDIVGADGYLRVDGLGHRYGLERLTLGRRSFDEVAPPENSWSFPDPVKPGPDEALKKLWQAVLQSIEGKGEAAPTGRDAAAALRIIEKIYANGESSVVSRES